MLDAVSRACGSVRPSVRRNPSRATALRVEQHDRDDRQRRVHEGDRERQTEPTRDAWTRTAPRGPRRSGRGANRAPPMRLRGQGLHDRRFERGVRAGNRRTGHAPSGRRDHRFRARPRTSPSSGSRGTVGDLVGPERDLVARDVQDEDLAGRIRILAGRWVRRDDRGIGSSAVPAVAPVGADANAIGRSTGCPR